MSKPNIKDFMLVIDESNIIVSVFPSESEFSSFINKKVESIITQESITDFQNFIQDLNQKNAALHHQIILNFSDINYSCHINGYKDEKTSLIFALFNTSSDEEIYKKMMHLNSQQVNELRMLRKNMQLQENQIYDEISKLNSELLNSKRIIEKQNSELQRYNKLLKQMSIEDSLTGCYNRRYFYDYMKESILPSQKDVIHSLVMIDFNNFKTVNDQFGHDAGDRLLINFVILTKDAIKEKGEIFRIGGDEFIIIFYDMDKEEVSTYMTKINNTFSSNSKIASLSYGIVTFNESELNHEFDLSNLVNKTDELMYIDKKYYKKNKESK